MKKIITMWLIGVLSTMLLIGNDYMVAGAKSNYPSERRTYTDSLVMEKPIQSIERGDVSAIFSYSKTNILKSKKVGNMYTQYIVKEGLINGEKCKDYSLEYIYGDFWGEQKCIQIIYNGQTYDLQYDDYGNVVSIYNQQQCVCIYEYLDGQLIPIVYCVENDEREVSDSEFFIGNLNPFRYQGWYFHRDIECYYIGTGIFYDPVIQEYIQNDYAVEDWGMKWLESNASTFALTQNEMNIIIGNYNAAMNSNLYGATSYSEVSQAEWNNGERWFDGVNALEVIARCIWAESSYASKTNDRTGIATVIMNRMAYTGTSGLAVVTKRAQFSTINPASLSPSSTNNARSAKSKTNAAWQQATMLGCVILYGSEKDDINHFYQIPTGISTQRNFRGLDYLSTLNYNGTQVTIGGVGKNDVAIAGYGYIDSSSKYEYLLGLIGQHYTLFFND